MTLIFISNQGSTEPGGRRWPLPLRGGGGGDGRGVVGLATPRPHAHARAASAAATTHAGSKPSIILSPLLGSLFHSDRSCRKPTFRSRAADRSRREPFDTRGR